MMISFDLAHQVKYFGEWLHEKDDAHAIVLAFAVEGWKGSAAVSLTQASDGRILGKVSGLLSEKRIRSSVLSRRSTAV